MKQPTFLDLIKSILLHENTFTFHISYLPPSHPIWSFNDHSSKELHNKEDFVAIFINGCIPLFNLGLLKIILVMWFYGIQIKMDYKMD